VTDPGPASLLQKARDLVRNGTPAVVVTVVRGDNPGARLLWTSAGVEGTLGSTERDDIARGLASQSLAEGRPGLQRLVEGVDVFVDVYTLPPLMVIIGAVHVAQALVPFAERLGFRIVVADARSTLATRERFPTVDDLLVAWPDDAYARLPISPTSAIVILTHDPKFDEPAILGALQTSAGYIGAVGSRKTNEDRRRRLLDAGVSEADLRRLHGPIGLNIGGSSPEEMAISILAEIIAVRNGRTGGSLKAAEGGIRGSASG
jgi:xanthine dehydrogenase accessory factor